MTAARFALTLGALALACALPRAGSCEFAVFASSEAEALRDSLNDLAKQREKGAFDAFFDGGRVRAKGSPTPVSALAGLFGAKSFPGLKAAGVKGLALLGVPSPVEKLSTEPGVKQKSLDRLQTTPDGNLYRSYKESPWWKFWDSSRSIQKAVPDKSGYTWNEKGEFVGDWQTVQKTDTDNFQVAKGKDGQDHVYTIRRSGFWQSGSPEVYRDGKYVTAFGERVGDWYDRDANLAEIRAGGDDKVYARYTKNSEDVILSVDAQSKKHQIAARVPAEIKIWTDMHSREVYAYTDEDGNAHTRTEFYTEQHVDRHGVEKFQVAADGKVYTQYKGNVYRTEQSWLDQYLQRVNVLPEAGQAAAAAVPAAAPNSGA